MNIYQPLKDHWKLDEDAGCIDVQISNRVNSEDNYTWAKGYPLIKSEDIYDSRRIQHEI